MATVTPTPTRIPAGGHRTHVPLSITVVRRSSGWPGLFMQGTPRRVGRRQLRVGHSSAHPYFFLKPLRQEVITPSGVRPVAHARANPDSLRPAFPSRSVGAGRFTCSWWDSNPGSSNGSPPSWASGAGPPVATNNTALGPGIPWLPRPRPRAELEDVAGSALAAEGLGTRHRRPDCSGVPATPAPSSLGRRPAHCRAPRRGLMRRRLTEPLTLGEIAAAAGLSPFHFARQFKAATGHPPHEYLVRPRVDRAQELLRTHGRRWTMAAIAQECGFSDQSHLARQFRRVLGVTPAISGALIHACLDRAPSKVRPQSARPYKRSRVFG